MTPTPDIRWQQRFSNYRMALDQLAEAVALRRVRDLSRLDAYLPLFIRLAATLQERIDAGR